MKTIDQIRREFERLGCERHQGNLVQAVEGIILGLDEMTGHPDIIEISETGPGGRLSILYDAMDVLRVLQPMEEAEDWYLQMLAEMEEIQPAPPLRFLSSSGEMLVDTFPAFAIP